MTCLDCLDARNLVTCCDCGHQACDECAHADCWSCTEDAWTCDVCVNDIGRQFGPIPAPRATLYEVLSFVGTVPLRRLIHGIGDAMRWAREDERRGRRAVVSSRGVVVYETEAA